MSFVRTGQVTDEYDRPVQGASIYVYKADGADAALTSDGTTPLAQPITTDEFGAYTYYVAAAATYREDTWFGGKLRFREIRAVGLDGLYPLAPRAGMFFAFDADGNPVAATGTGGGDAALRTDLAANTGSTLILHKSAISGTYARSLRQWAAVGGFDERNVMNWIDSDADDDIMERVGSIDVTAMIDSALGYVEGIAGPITSSGGAKLIFPGGAFRNSAAHQVGANVSIEGDAQTGTIIYSTHAGTGTGDAGARSGSTFYSEFPVNLGTNVANISIKNLLLYNDNAANIGAGYYDQGGTRISIGNVEVRGHKMGFLFDQTELLDADLITLQAQLAGGMAAWFVNGPDLNPSAAGLFTNRNSIKRAQINEPGTVNGIVHDGGDTFTAEDINFNGCLAQLRLAGIQSGSVVRSRFESAASHCIDLFSTSLSGRGVGGCFADVQGGWFAATSGNAAVNCNSGAGTLKVEGVPFFTGGGGTNPITGGANLAALGLGSFINNTAVAVVDAKPDKFVDLSIFDMDLDGNVTLPGDLTLVPPASATPASNGQMTFELTSNTTLTVKVKGSDGTVRSVALTLA